MSFIQHFASVLAEHPDKPLFTEVHDTRLVPYTGHQLSDLARRARATLAARDVAPGDRVVLLAPNSARWLAIDLAVLTHGAIAVPMYARQAADELVAMMHDCAPTLVVCATTELADAVRERWPEAPLVTFDEAFAPAPLAELTVAERPADDPVTIIYTSGTSGEPKGVVYSQANCDFMLPVVRDAITSLMGTRDADDRVFHYLPFCFAGSRVVLWMCLYRANNIMASTDLTHLALEMKTARPNYFLNVPALLERVKSGVEGKIRGKPKLVQALYDKGKASFFALAAGRGGALDRLAYGLARRVVYDKVRQQIGAALECLICGSAPLGEETQRWFEMLGIPVYQVYGLTETTAIVTMDKPRAANPGRVGHAIPGVELRLGEGDELQTRGANTFTAYWGRDQAYAEAFTDDGWFRTGDQCELDPAGSLRVIGRVKNLLVPSSGHNVPPEPIEQKLLEIEGVEQAVLIGHGRPFLTAIVTGAIDRADLEAALDGVNAELPHYRRVRKFHLTPDILTPESGLLTANQKLKRRAIEAHFAAPIDQMYAS